MSAVTQSTPAAAQTDAAPEKRWRPPSYWPFVVPALVVVLAIIIFPWVFTIWMSLNEWKVGSPTTFVGLANYLRLPTDPRFVEAVGHTLVYTVLSVVLPLILGTLAAVVFHQKFAGRGFLRGIFIMPMMATPVAIALVWTMMFHPQLGVLNYLLSLVGIPPQLWVFHPATVIPSLVLVETWQWTPLVMLIVLGGLAAIPTEPYESAQIDGASFWQVFRFITLPLIMPFLFIAGMIRMIDAVKSFDIIFAITQGGPGSASETINIYLYSVAFVYYDLGYGSAIAVVFFLLIVALAAVMLYVAPAHAVDRNRERRMNLVKSTYVRSSGQIGLWLSVFVIVSPAILFFLWMASLSLKFEVDNAAYPPVFIPERIAWKNYADVLASNRFLTYFINSLIVTGCATVLALLVGVPAGYGIARMAAHKSAIVILIARITPGLSYLIPLFLLFQWLGLLGTLVPQIIIHLVVTVPIVIWIMIGYFETTPLELEEAALIDGATRWQVFRHVALPIAKPGLAVAFILAGDLLLEQFRVRHRAGRTRDAHAAGRRLQHDLVRPVELGPARRRRADRHLPGAAAHRVRPAADRRRADRGRRQGRVISLLPVGGFILRGGASRLLGMRASTLMVRRGSAACSNREATAASARYSAGAACISGCAA